MKYYFDDIINGLKIKKQIISEYYNDLEYEILNPMYMNFLEFYKACIFNLFYSNFDKKSLKQIIKEQLENDVVIEISEFMIKKEFDIEFVQAINRKDVNYLYNISRENHRKKFIKDKVMSTI